MKEYQTNNKNPYMNNNNAQGNMRNRGNRENKQMQKSNNMSMNNQNPYLNKNSMGFSTSEVLAGLLIGAAATYILTNENVQKTIFKGMVSMGDVITGGMDEMKERFEDAKAEHEAAKEA
ncbi:YtxH domain-containing protein [Sulfurimonas sp.]|uniref:YtxH domain-containing protein n=1 Tax=Sulfurimonas sp. TaxID=2022749 RepID=UPI002AB200C1|nr:YtxH domain-containing protein [Sulfurimonas sp.]